MLNVVLHLLETQPAVGGFLACFYFNIQPRIVMAQLHQQIVLGSSIAACLLGKCGAHGQGVGLDIIVVLAHLLHRFILL